MPLSAPHLLVSIEAAFLIETPRFLWALSIHQDQTGSRLAPLSVANLAGERGDDGLPDALFPSAKSVVDGALCGEVVGELVRLNAGLVDVNEGIDDLAQWDGGGSSSRRWWGLTLSSNSQSPAFYLVFSTFSSFRRGSQKPSTSGFGPAHVPERQLKIARHTFGVALEFEPLPIG